MWPNDSNDMSYNLIDFNSLFFEGQKVGRSLLVALVLNPVIPYRVETKENGTLWVIKIPVIQSAKSAGFIEIWSRDKRELPALLCRGQIIITDSISPVKILGC